MVYLCRCIFDDIQDSQLFRKNVIVMKPAIVTKTKTDIENGKDIH